jgi:molybdopterin molybdotransferase
MVAISLAEAQQFVVANCSRLPVVEMPVGQALGCVLAEDIVSAEAVPPFANTAMDGFAVRAVDVASVPVELPVIATLAAGGEPLVAVGPGQAVRIMTGAAVPAGADAIVPIEHTDPTAPADIVRILQSSPEGASIRRAGEDVTVGQTVFQAGDTLSAGHLGVLASIGLVTVPVYRRVRVGVLSTGDELVAAPTPLRLGQIRDSNRQTLLALLTLANVEAVDLGVARDTESEIRERVLAGIENCDALVTSGGVSVGDFDFVKVVLDQLSTASAQPMRWMQIAIRPAKPLAFGLIAGKPVFGLPGNPVSSMVSFELFARPGLRRMMGHNDDRVHRRPIRGIAGEDFARTPDGKTHFARVRAEFDAEGRLVARSSGGQASNLLRSMALANALAVVPNGPSVKAGSPIDVILLD